MWQGLEKEGRFISAGWLWLQELQELLFSALRASLVSKLSASTVIGEKSL